jgi:hypothetical protein
MYFNVLKHRAKQLQSFLDSSSLLFSIRHWPFATQSPEANFWMNLKCPLLAMRTDNIVYLFNL